MLPEDRKYINTERPPVSKGDKSGHFEEAEDAYLKSMERKGLQIWDFEKFAYILHCILGMGLKRKHKMHSCFLLALDTWARSDY